MARRSSARLRDRASSTTPKRVSLSHDAQPKTPRTAPPVRLTALHEIDEIPGAFPQSVSPPPLDELPSSSSATVPMMGRGDRTPAKAGAIEPSEHEMHPQLHHQSTAKPLDEARWLGFTSKGPHTEPVKRSTSSKIAHLQESPTRSSSTKVSSAPDAEAKGTETPKFKFTFRREQSLELSPAAKKLMLEKREEAARIREQMIANGEGRAAADVDVESINAAVARKIATPKGKKNRFSQVHLDQFRKMDSIAGHASAFRADPNHLLKTAGPSDKGVTQQQQHRLADEDAATATAKPNRSPAKPSSSLKRSPSKAQLDDHDTPTSRLPTTSSSASKGRLTSNGPAPGRVGTAPKQDDGASSDLSSPSKRVKRTDGDDTSVTRPTTATAAKHAASPATPKVGKVTPRHGVPFPLASLASPTAASLARASSVKSARSTKIPAPAPLQSPSKSTEMQVEYPVLNLSDNLLSRSPSKAIPTIKSTVQPAVSEQKASSEENQFLLRSPTRAPHPKHSSVGGETQREGTSERASAKQPLLSRSPVKMPAATKSTAATDQDATTHANNNKQSPLLSRSPMKISVAPSNSKSEAHGHESSSSSKAGSTATTSIPLLARSPAKIALPSSTVGDNPSSSKDSAATPSKTPGGGVGALQDRFKLLRASPIKSILRSPQRLYSDDPAKIAAGTHLATPPRPHHSNAATTATSVTTASASRSKQSCHPSSSATPSQSSKKVDFTSSTKARYERAQSDEVSGSGTPSKTPTPGQNSHNEESETSSTSMTPHYPLLAGYPSLPETTSTSTGDAMEGLEEQRQAEAEPGTPVLSTPQQQKKFRRQTATPADFTFRAGTHEIIFSPSPVKGSAQVPALAGRSASAAAVAANPGTPKRAAIGTTTTAPTVATSGGNTPTIRHVAAEPAVVVSTPVPATGSKKRKFEFENEQTAGAAAAASASASDPNLVGYGDKENHQPINSMPTNDDNDDEAESHERPAKRAKPSTQHPSGKTKTSAQTAAAAMKARSTSASVSPVKQNQKTRMPTLGVKAKGSKTPVVKSGRGGVKGRGAGAPAAAGGGTGGDRAGQAPSTISLSRLNALAQPKKRD